MRIRFLFQQVLEVKVPNLEFNELHQRVIKNEFEFALAKNKSELEEIVYNKNFASVLALIPIATTIHTIFKNAIDTCNEYGDFIEQNFIITNVKKLNESEILEFIEKNKISGISDQSSIDTIE